MIVTFDVVGTLFSPDKAQRALEAQGQPADLMPLWFARLLQTAGAATLAGRYTPFADAAEASLRQLLAQRGVPQDKTDPTVRAALDAMRSLDPWPDAPGALDALRAAGHRLVALTNSSADAAHALMDRAGLADRFEHTWSVDEARACKPDPRPYRWALKQLGIKPAEACMVAAHGWDVLGAAAVGLHTVWITRLETAWPFPGQPPHATCPTLAELPGVVCGDGSGFNA